MGVTHEERGKLVELLVAVVPGFDDRLSIANKSGLKDVQIAGSPVDSWRHLIDEAIAQDRLESLFRVASRTSGLDWRLVTVAEGLEKGEIRLPSRSPGGVVFLAIVIVIAVLGVGLVQWCSSPEASTDPAAVASEPKTEPAVELTANPTSAPTSAAPTPAPVAPAVPVPLAPVAPAPAPAPRPPAVAAGSLTDGNGGCPGERGQVIGYVYAGADKPGDQGTEWTVPSAVNVRAEYPSFRNEYSSKTKVECVLYKGNLVMLVNGPIEVSGGAWWVPVVAGAVK